MLFAGLYDSVTLEGEHQAIHGGGVQEIIYLILLMAGGRAQVSQNHSGHSRSSRRRQVAATHGYTTVNP